MKSVRSIRRAIWLTFCEADERYLDLVRVGYAATLAVALGLAIWAVASGQEFNMVDFGTGVAIILFGGGAGIGIRGRLEDGPSNDKPEEERNQGRRRGL